MIHIMKLSGVRLMVGLLLGLAGAEPARAEMILSHVIVDLAPGTVPSNDIEIWNTDEERLYVVVEPVEVISPGLPEEQRVQRPDPEQLGLLVTPNRLILEPGQRKRVRITALSPRGAVDRIYRVAIKPVAGDLAAKATALKVLVGYDVLVMLRPEEPTEQLSASRHGRTITFRNDGNTNIELFDGRQCDAKGGRCVDLPGKRLYAGAVWTLPLPYDAPLDYAIKVGDKSGLRHFQD